MQFQCNRRARSRPPSLAGIQVGPIDVLRYSGLGEQWGGRDQRLIRSQRADYYVICAPAAARLFVRQNECSADLRRGSFTVVSTARPFEARIRSEVDEEFFSAVHVRVPGSLLRRRIPDIDDICGREVRVLPGSRRLMLSQFDLALSEGPYLSADERTRFGNRLLEIVSDVVQVLAASAEPRMPKPCAHQRAVESAKAFIASRLSDPDLDPARVAEHCGVSTRFLHLAFAERSEASVAKLIRESRLQACREALNNPKLHGRRIIEIAGDWGFDDPAHFSRLYKARFGRAPREDHSAAAGTIAA